MIPILQTAAQGAAFYVANRALSYSSETLPYFFPFAAMRNLNAWIHEAGHALAARALLIHPNPQITLNFLFGQGKTALNIHSPSPLGQKIGPQRIMPLVAAAGPLLTLALSASLLITAKKIEKSYPRVSRFLSQSASLNFYSHAYYAISALAHPGRLSHDFVVLSNVGLHPLVAAIALVAIPTLIKRVF